MFFDYFEENRKLNTKSNDMAVDPKVNAILYLRFGRVHIGLTLYHYRNKKQYGYKKGNNIAVDPATPVILSKAKYLCSAWL